MRLQGAIELGTSNGVSRTDFDSIDIEELINKFREACKNRDKKILCITIQVAFPDDRSLGEVFTDAVEYEMVGS